MTHPTQQGQTPQGNRQESGSPVRNRLILLGVVVVAIVLAAWGIVERGVHYHSLSGVTEEAAIPPVTLISPQPGPKTRQVDLPANLAAWYEAPIYAQVSGYVKMLSLIHISEPTRPY